MDNSRNKQNSDQQTFFKLPRVDIPPQKDREPGEPTIYERNKALNPFPTFSEAKVAATYEEQMGPQFAPEDDPRTKADNAKPFRPRLNNSGHSKAIDGDRELDPNTGKSIHGEFPEPLTPEQVKSNHRGSQMARRAMMLTKYDRDLREAEGDHTLMLARLRAAHEQTALD